MPSRPVRRLLAAAALAALLGSACGDSSPTGSTLAADPEQILAAAAAAMTEVETLRFELTRSGAPITVANLEFDAAAGQYLAPDSAQAILRVKAGDVPAEVATIAIGERVWITNPLTGGWEEFPEGTGFNPAIIFDPEVGWKPLLGEDLSDEQLADERAPDDDAYVVTGTVAPARVAVLTAGLVEDQAVEVELWVHPATAEVLRVAFSTDSEEGVSDWVLTLSEFGEPVTIEPPTE